MMTNVKLSLNSGISTDSVVRIARWHSGSLLSEQHNNENNKSCVITVGFYPSFSLHFSPLVAAEAAPLLQLLHRLSLHHRPVRVAAPRGAAASRTCPLETDLELNQRLIAADSTDEVGRVSTLMSPHVNPILTLGPYVYVTNTQRDS